MKKTLFFLLLLSATQTCFSQDTLKFFIIDQTKVDSDGIGWLYPFGYENKFVSFAEQTYIPQYYISQEDTSGNTNWMLICPPDQKCSIFQASIAGSNMTYNGLRFRPGQTVFLKDNLSVSVKIADFNDFKSGNTSYPVLLFDRPYYLVYFRGYWTYLSEDVLSAE